MSGAKRQKAPGLGKTIDTVIKTPRTIGEKLGEYLLGGKYLKGKPSRAKTMKAKKW